MLDRPEAMFPFADAIRRDGRRRPEDLERRDAYSLVAVSAERNLRDLQ